MKSGNVDIDLKLQICDLRLFCHGIYEYKKGVRNLILTTEKSLYKVEIERRLTQENIAYLIHSIDNDKINVFFGAKDCINIVKTFEDKNLNELTPEQDFILGIMLGYDELPQYRRYLERLGVSYLFDCSVNQLKKYNQFW